MLTLPRAFCRALWGSWHILGGRHSIYPVSTDQHDVVRGFALGAFPVLWFGFFKRNSASLPNKKQDFAGAMGLSPHRPIVVHTDLRRPLSSSCSWSGWTG
jgi:hypothetical protein